MFLSMEGFNSRLNTTGKLVNQKIKSEENVWNRTLKDKRMENRENNIHDIKTYRKKRSK